ncbi:MAG: gliding motility lipoprotein GldD [Chitinophagales bacterium]|nr:MAG: gliding motility lipoprotein GldD [Chitinophagales bacterium]
MIKRTLRKTLFLLCLLLLLHGCDEPTTPRPRGYFRIDLPQKAYSQYVSDSCPFTFKYPVYAEIVRDSLFFGEPVENPCWMDIHFPELGAKVHLSYKPINDQNNLYKLLEDAHKLSFKHTGKAQYIDESLIKNTHGVSGLLYEIGGDAASNVQFFLTDSVHHYLRGALYFNAIPNEDSLAPVIQFIKQDLQVMIETFQWVEKAPSGK